MDIYGSYSPQADKLLKPDGSITTFSGEIIAPPDSNRAKMYESISPIAAKWLRPDGSITDKLPISNGNASRLYTTDTEPEDWQDGDVWLETIDGTNIEATPIAVVTIPFDETKPFHLELGGINETLLNTTDNEQTATEDDLIIV